MSVDTRIPRSACEGLVVFVGDVLARLGIPIALGQAEVDDVDDVLLLAMANEEVVRLHVAMNKVVIVQELQSLDHLVSYHERGFDGELALAEVERILQTRSQQVHDHRVVVSLDAEPVYARDARCSLKVNDASSLTSAVKYFVNLRLIKQLRELCLHRLEFYRNIVASFDVGACTC